jgi:hypothetical protein
VLKLWLSLTTFGVDAFRFAIAHAIAPAGPAEVTVTIDPRTTERDIEETIARLVAE